MNLIPPQQFLAWADSVGVMLDPIYAPPKCLVHKCESAERRWWDTPRTAQALDHFIRHLLNHTEPWRSYYLWRRGGVWTQLKPPLNLLDDIRSVVRTGPAIPMHFHGAVEYTHQEFEHLAGQIAMHVASGWCVINDLFIVPDHGRFIIQTDHHDVVHVGSRDNGDMSRLTEHMATGGYALPTELLDWTFKRPGWMK